MTQFGTGLPDPKEFIEEEILVRVVGSHLFGHPPARPFVDITEAHELVKKHEIRVEDTPIGYMLTIDGREILRSVMEALLERFVFDLYKPEREFGWKIRMVAHRVWVEKAQ